MATQSFAVIVPAAGRSVRFGGGRGKLLEPLAGVPVICRTIQAFLSREDVSAIIIAVPVDERAALAEALRELVQDSRVRFVAGGACRARSVLNALRETSADSRWVAVHDAARPLVSRELIDRTFAAAVEHGAAVPALPVPLTIKQATGPLPAKVERTLERDALWVMQTPQTMRRDELLAAFETCPLPLDRITDDAQLLELAGREVWLVEGEERNLKITTRADLRIAEMFLASS